MSVDRYLAASSAYSRQSSTIRTASKLRASWFSFSIPHSTFFILHLGVRGRAKTEMKNVE
ncbi:MAG: hypothetical protein NDJ92_09095 [Thermoanaerobaculia bacterium]|nr:hypothetical protein [Thermoanaerobaculia bacterium]